jgi:hypothetical protein
MLFLTLATEIQVMMAPIRPPMAPQTAPAGEQSFHVMENAIGITAEPIMIPMNCKK